MADGEPVDQEEAPQPVPPLEQEQVKERLDIWNQIFSDLPANKVKAASLKEREETGKQDDASLTYSELDFNIVNDIITMLKNQHTRLYSGKGIFLDVGSGCGKACVAAGLCHPFEKVVGIETMQCLDDMAKAAHAKYMEVPLSAEGADPAPEKPEIQFIKGDFVADLEATLAPIAPQIAVCLCVATCLGDEQLNALASLAEKMSDNAIFVTLSQALPDRIIGGDKKLPQERYRDLLKAALSKRGTDPASVEIDPNPPDAKPGGWRLMNQEDMGQDVKLPVGGAPMELSTKMFVFKRLPLPESEQPQDAEPQADADA
jgi:precorrin-6B methylase 2